MEYKNEHIEALESAARDVSLTHAERASMRTALRGYMLDHPARRGVFATFLSYEVMAFRLHPVAFGLVLSLSLGVGTSFAAEGTLPGDTLYQVKVLVNEPLQRAVALTPDSKVKVAQVQVERRLEEAELLAAQGKLTAPVSAELATRLHEHVNDFDTNVVGVATDDAVSTRSDFDASLEAHGDVLAQITESIPEETSLAPVVELVHKRVEEIARMQESKRLTSLLAFEVSTDTPRIVQKRKGDAERKLALAGDSEDRGRSAPRMALMKMAVESEETASLASLSVTNETPREAFSRGESELEKGALAPALVAFDEAARGAERARVRRDREQVVKPLLEKRKGGRSERKEQKEKTEDRPVIVPVVPVGTSLETTSPAQGATTTISASTTLPTSNSGSGGGQDLYPHEEKPEDH